MLYFFEKAEKIAQRWGFCPQSPGGWGFRPQTPKLLLSIILSVAFEHCSDFTASLKLRPIISYLSDG